MTDMTKPPRKPIDIPVVRQQMINNRVLWDEASRFRWFLRDLRQLDPDTMLAEADDVRWVVFFLFAAKYFIHEQDYLHKLLTDPTDIPF
jgi:hypothetical protein